MKQPWQRKTFTKWFLWTALECGLGREARTAVALIFWRVHRGQILRYEHEKKRIKIECPNFGKARYLAYFSKVWTYLIMLMRFWSIKIWPLCTVQRFLMQWGMGGRLGLSNDPPRTCPKTHQNWMSKVCKTPYFSQFFQSLDIQFWCVFGQVI